MKNWVEWTYVRVLGSKVDPNDLVIGTYGSHNDYKYVINTLGGYFVDSVHNAQKSGRWSYIPLSKFVKRRLK